MAKRRFVIEISNQYDEMYMVCVQKDGKCGERFIVYSNKIGENIILKGIGEYLDHRDDPFFTTTDPKEADKRLYERAKGLAQQLQRSYKAFTLPTMIIDKTGKDGNPKYAKKTKSSN